MESSLLRKLPPEIRLQIHAYVFDGATATILVGHDVDTQAQVDSSLKPLIRYRFSPDCSLAATCRAIRIESADTMWRNVFVKAGHHWTTKRVPCGALPLRAPITLEMLNSVLPDAIAQHITRLANVLFSENGDATTCLLKYPNLKVCIIDNSYLASEFVVRPVLGFSCILERWHDYYFLKHLPLPMTIKGRKKPSLVLEEKFGIKPDSGIQIIGRELLHNARDLILSDTLQFATGLCIVPESTLVWSKITDAETDI